MEQNKTQFKPGNPGNLKGRGANTPNKVTKIMRERVIKILDNNWQRIQEDLDSLEPKDRLNFLEKMMSYTLPKLSMVKGEMDIRSTGAEGLSNSQLTQFILQVAKPTLDDPNSSELPI